MRQPRLPIGDGRPRAGSGRFERSTEIVRCIDGQWSPVGYDLHGIQSVRSPEMRDLPRVLTGVAIGLLAPFCSLAFDLDRFESEMEVYARSYDELARRQEVNRLLMQADVDGYHSRLIAEVPDAEKTFYDYFVLANLLFREARQQSYEFMRMAEALDPDNPFVWYERGIHEHRRGNCEAALDYYRRLHDAHPELAGPVSWAYRTHCALRTGNVGEAFAAWQEAEFGSNHTAIEKGMYVIFSDARPHSSRQSLVAKIEGGEHQAICDLLRHDRSWEVDWWNRREMADLLDTDLALAESILASGTPDHAVMRLCIDAPELSDAEFESALTAAGLWGENAELPSSPALLYDMTVRLTSNQAASPESLLDTFGAELWQRFQSGNVERPFVEVLGYLYSTTGDGGRLRKVDLYGWRELGLERFAVSYLAGTNPHSPEYSGLLDEALADFPNSALLQKVRLARLAGGPGHEQAMSDYVAAEFANVLENWKGPYRLHDFMASLAHELGR